MRKPKLVLLIIFIVNIKLTVFSQQLIEYDCFLKAQFHFGYIMQHRNAMSHLVNGHIYGAELNWASQTKGEKLWHYENNFPEKGIAVHFYSLANPNQLGQLIGFAPYYDIGLNEKNKAMQVRDYVASLILRKKVLLKGIQKDKYGRLLADVYFDNMHVNQWMIDNNYAVSYDGGKKQKFNVPNTEHKTK